MSAARRGSAAPTKAAVISPTIFVPAVLGLVGWTALDALFAALDSSGPIGWTPAWAAGIAAPWALGLGLFAACVSRGIDQLRTTGEKATAPRPPSERAAIAVAACFGAGAGLAAAVVLGRAIASSVQTPLFVTLGVLGAGGLGVALGASVSLALLPPVTRTIAPLIRRWPPLAALLRPARILLAAALMCAAGSTALLLRSEGLSASLPWARLGIATVSLLSIFAASRGTKHRERTAGVVRRAALPVAVSAIAVGLSVATSSGSSLRDALARRRTIASSLLAATDRLADFDGDGVPSLYGGADCAPFDGARGPHREEIADNGEDEDCSGHDLRMSTLPLERGRGHHGRAADVPIAPRPHIVLITTDALSYAHTSLGGYHRDVTPQLKGWAERATSFRLAFSTSSATCNALPALLSGTLTTRAPGLLPPQNQAKPGGRSAPTLPAMLRGAGYTSVALPGTRILTREAWPSLMAQFDDVDAEPIDRADPQRRSAKPYAAPHLVRRALEHLDRASDDPLFLWVHFFDHHPVYGLPPETPAFGSGVTEVDRYDTELSFADRHWGELLRGIEARFRPEEVVVIFSSDHGEAFDADHPRAHHDQSLHNAETHVPLIIQAATERGRTRSGLVSHLDIVPTVADLVGLAPDPDLLGESLLPVITGPREPEKTYVVGIHWQPRGAPFGSPALRSMMIRTDQWLWIDDREHGLSGLYAPGVDPLGTREISRHHPDEAEWMRSVLRSTLADHLPAD